MIRYVQDRTVITGTVGVAKKIAARCIGQLWVEAEEIGANKALGFSTWVE